MKKFTFLSISFFLITSIESNYILEFFKKLLFFLLFSAISITAFSQAPNYEWAKAANGTSYERGKSIATDLSGNVFITGWFQSDSITFGNTTLYNATIDGTADIFIVKYNNVGNILWAKSFGGNSQDAGASISTNKFGDVFVTGYFQSSKINFSTQLINNSGLQDIFIAKFDLNGNFTWVKSFGGSYNDEPSSITVDKYGNAIITGGFSSFTINFGSFILTRLMSPIPAVFVAKINSNGNCVWARTFGNDGYQRNDFSNGVATDDVGNVFIVGYFNSNIIACGLDTLKRSSDYTGTYSDIFIAKYDSNGLGVWAKSAKGFRNDNINSIVTDKNGNLYITGYFSGDEIAFGNTKLYNNSVDGYMEFFIAKYNNNGNLIWVKGAKGDSKFKGHDSDMGTSLTTNIDGEIFILGEFQSPSITFGSTTIYGNLNCVDASYDLFVTKMSNSLGIEMSKIPKGVNIFPNPFSNSCYLKFEAEQLNTNIKIVDALGRIYKETQFSGLEYLLEKDNLDPGIYFVLIVDSNNLFTSKRITVL